MALLAALTVVALVTGTVAAMVVTQKARREGPVASNIRLKVKPGARYRACFHLTRDDVVGTSIVDAEGTVVRTLAREPLSGDAPHCYDWDGRSDLGQPLTPGRYRLRLSLADTDRVATSGERLRIEEGQ